MKVWDSGKRLQQEEQVGWGRVSGKCHSRGTEGARLMERDRFCACQLRAGQMGRELNTGTMAPIRASVLRSHKSLPFQPLP